MKHQTKPAPRVVHAPRIPTPPPPPCDTANMRADDTIFRGISDLACSVHEIEGRLSVTLERLTGQSYSGLADPVPQSPGILGAARGAMDAAQSSAGRIHSMLTALEGELPTN